MQVPWPIGKRVSASQTSNDYLGAWAGRFLLVRNTRISQLELKNIKLRSKVKNTKTNFLAKKKQSSDVFRPMSFESMNLQVPLDNQKEVNFDVTAQVSTDKKNLRFRGLTLRVLYK